VFVFSQATDWGSNIYNHYKLHSSFISEKTFILRVCKEVVSKVNTGFPKKMGNDKAKNPRQNSNKYIKKDQNILLKYHKAMIPVYVD